MSPRSSNIIQHPLMVASRHFIVTQHPLIAIPRHFIVIPRYFIIIPRYFIVIPAKAGITGNIMNNAISRRSSHHIAPAPIHRNHANKRRAA